MPNPHAWQGAPGYLETVSWAQAASPTTPARRVMAEPAGVAGGPTTTSPTMQRLAMVVDSANGVGAALDPDEFLFMNTDTAVHLHRVPRGDDFALRSRASIGPDGIGVCNAEIFDRQGFIGTSAQTLLVQRR